MAALLRVACGVAVRRIVAAQGDAAVLARAQMDQSLPIFTHSSHSGCAGRFTSVTAAM
jgi:hypothetical protein